MKTHNTARPYWLPKPRLLLTVVLGVGLTLSVLLFAGARKTWAPEALLASGLILTATLAAYLALNARRTAQLAQVNQQLVAEVAERQRAEQSLRASESRYRLLFESNPHPMWVFDRETLAFLQVNEAAIRHYGYSRSEFLAMTSKDIRPAEDVPALLVDITKATGLRQSGTWRHRKKDGALILVDITIHPLDFDGRPAHLVLANDVTERKAAEAALRQQHETLQAIVENAPLMISCVGPDTRIKWINRAWKDTLKWSLEDTRTQDLFAALYPEPETRREFFDLLDKANGLRIPMISDTQSEIVGHRSDNYRTVVGA